jgi:hypothetical protein
VEEEDDDAAGEGRYVMDVSLSSNAMGKREAILARKRVSSFGEIGPVRRMVIAPLITWQFLPEVVGAQVSGSKEVCRGKWRQV